MDLRHTHVIVSGHDYLHVVWYALIDHRLVIKVERILGKLSGLYHML